MAVIVVGELVVGSRKLLEALGSDAREISGELERERANKRERSVWRPRKLRKMKTLKH